MLAVVFLVVADVAIIWKWDENAADRSESSATECLDRSVLIFTRVLYAPSQTPHLQPNIHTQLKAALADEANLAGGH